VDNKKVKLEQERIAIVSSKAFSLTNFRGPLIEEWTGRGMKVFALAPDFDDSSRESVRALGATPIDIYMSRTGRNPLSDLWSIITLVLVFRKLKLNTVFCYYIKPVIYGMLASRIARTNNRYSLIAGGGYVFSKQKKHRVLHRLLKSVVCFMCRRGVHKATKVFFQNDEDLKNFVELKLISKDRTIITGGTGVDLDILKQITPNTDDITFILVARLLQEKGIEDFVDAARIVRNQAANVKFILVGDFDTSPGGICKTQVDNWVKDGIVEWPGEVTDVYSWLTKSSVFVLPSYYREGVPRSTQEALATGLPVITTDSVGCRDTVIEGETGLLVPARDTEALSDAMLYFIKNPSEIKRMGSAARKFAEQKFDVHKINKIILNAMGID